MRDPDFRFTRKNLPFEFRDYHGWPLLDESCLSEMQHTWYARMRAAICAYLDGGHFGGICREQHTSRSEVLRLLNACVSCHPDDGRILGWRALVKGERRNGYVRSAEVRPHPNGKGMAGAFAKLLAEHPTVKDDLQALALRKKTSEPRVHGVRDTGADIHAEFERLLRKDHVRDVEYPFFTDDHARKAVQTFVADTRAANFARGARVLGGRDAARRAAIGTGHERQLISERPFDIVVADAHRFDFLGTVRIPHHKGWRRVVLQRLNFLPVFEEFSRAVLGYVVVIRQQCNGQDAVRAFKSALEPWQPREVRTLGLSYPPGAGMPSSLVPQLAGASWALLKVDNDSIFLAKGTAERTRRRVGCAINYGPVGLWVRRDLIEAFFGIFERRGFQRLPSTTGSHPKDSRRDDAEGKAIALEIDWEEVLDLIAIQVATYNVTPQAGLGGRSPVQVLQEYVQHADSGYFRRLLPPLAVGEPDLNVIVESRRICGSVAGGRAPYVEIDEVEYRNPLLAQAGQLIGTQLLVHINEQEMRTVTAYLPKGGTIGVLTASGDWGRIPHDRGLRKAINALARKGELPRRPGEDAITCYLRQKGSKALSDTKKSKAKRVSKAATEVARVAEMTGLDIPVASEESSIPRSMPLATPPPVRGLFPPPKHRVVR